MSKMDALRAMREARYEQRNARPTTPRATPTKAASPAKPPAARPATAEPAESPAAPVDDALCGHRAISGRTCTREKGHAAKSHRYA